MCLCWEYYFAILLEREFNGPVIVGSPMGGMDIEEVAEKHPDALKMIGVDIKEGLTDDKAREMAIFMGFQGNKLLWTFMKWISQPLGFSSK